MVTKVNKWGNSLGVRIPKEIIEKLNITIDSKVEFSINSSNDVVLDVVNDVLKIADIKEKVLEEARKYSIKQVFLFGSYARKDMNENSDIDLLVDFSEITDNDYPKVLINLITELRSKLGKKIDIIDIENLTNDKFSKQVRQEAIRLL